MVPPSSLMPDLPLKLPNEECQDVGYANILRKDLHLTLRVKT